MRVEAAPKAGGSSEDVAMGGVDDEFDWNEAADVRDLIPPLTFPYAYYFMRYSHRQLVHPVGIKRNAGV